MSKRNTDFLDDLFRSLEDNDNIDQTIEEFTAGIQQTIHESLHRNGYDTMSDVLHRRSQSEYSRKPEVRVGTQKASSIGLSRYEYFLSLLEDITYDPKYQGYYKEGHQKAIEIYRSKAEFTQYDLVSLEDDVKGEIHRAELNRKNKDLFDVGYYDGLEFIEKALQRSKLYMMTLVKEEMECY